MPKDLPKKLGLLAETRPYPDGRVAFSPAQARMIQREYPHIEILVQPSPSRAFHDREYADQGITLTHDLSACDILMGIKQVAIPTFIPGKTYFFFSHTIKQQPQNREMMRAMVSRKISLVDYEVVTNQAGERVVAFGRYAGVVGAYNGLIAYGIKFSHYRLPRAYTFTDQHELYAALKQVQWPAIKIALTGGGRVAKGAIETLTAAGVQRVSVEDFLTKTYTKPVYTQLHSGDYHVNKVTGGFDQDEFYQYPSRYRSMFMRYAGVTDLLIVGNYWNPQAPRLFSRQDMQSPEFKIEVIADVTCDIEGSVPVTKKATTIADPFMDYDPDTDQMVAPFKANHLTTVMAVDNLPCELARGASEDFGDQLMGHVFPSLLGDQNTDVIQRATILDRGRLTPAFAYLRDYAEAGSAHSPGDQAS